MTSSSRLVIYLTNKILQLVANEIKKKDIQDLVTQQIITPMLSIVTKSIQPYVIAFVILIIVMFAMVVVQIMFLIHMFFNK